MLGVMWACEPVRTHHGLCLQLICTKSDFSLQFPTLPCPDEEVVSFALFDVQPGHTLHCNDGALLWGKVHLQMRAGLESCMIFCPEGCLVKLRNVWQVASGVWRHAVGDKLASQWLYLKHDRTSSSLGPLSALAGPDLIPPAQTPRKLVTARPRYDLY
eukprot:jgi/Astpho2/6378/fgenesh1_pg.00091_%23_40_t